MDLKVTRACYNYKRLMRLFINLCTFDYLEISHLCYFQEKKALVKGSNILWCYWNVFVPEITSVFTLSSLLMPSTAFCFLLSLQACSHILLRKAATFSVVEGHPTNSGLTNKPPQIPNLFSV